MSSGRTITNSGTLPLRYAVSSRTTEAVLSARLDMTVKDGVTHCTDAGFAADGTVLYGPGDAGTVTGQPVIGDVSTGQQAGDRTAQPGANQRLCVQLVLPVSADNSFQSLTTTATLDFHSEQRILMILKTFPRQGTEKSSGS